MKIIEHIKRIKEKVAPKVASIMAKETGKDKIREEEHVKAFNALAGNYVLN